MDDRLSIGIDIGQKVDPTCAAVVETRRSKKRLVRVIKRLPLGTPYPKVAHFILGLLFAPELINRNCLVRIDVTGVGLPVVDLVRDLLRRMDIGERRIELEPLSFRHGETYNRATGTLGKMYLVSNLQTLLQQGLVQMDDTPETKALQQELLNYEIRVSEAGKDTYGVFKTGKHDDMATALALACLPLPVLQIPLSGDDDGIFDFSVHDLSPEAQAQLGAYTDAVNAARLSEEELDQEIEDVKRQLARVRSSKEKAGSS